jgi:predicted permease
METLWRDTRYAVRTFSKTPGFALIIVISIGLGIGANATVFSIANGILWGILPVRDPGRLVTFAEGNTLSYPDFVDYRDQTAQVFEGGVCAHFPLIPASLGGKGESERVWGQAVSGNYFSVAGVNLALGRSILPTDDMVRNRDAVVVLSHGLWQRRFGSDPAIVGHDVILNGQRYTVVGVAAAGFYGTDRGMNAEFWVPLAMTESIMPDLASLPGEEQKDSLRTARDNHWLILNARLKAGVGHPQAVAAVNVVKKRLNDTYRKDEKQHRPPMTLDPASGLMGGAETPALSLMAVLMVVTGFVLLVACANVANLMLARATGRQREIAVRLAMGAGRARLIRQLLTESILLSFAGAAAGFALAVMATRVISRFELPLPFPIVFDLNVDARVLAFTAALSILTGVLFGLAPALRATRPNLVAELKNESTIFGRSRGFGLRNSLVVVQVALSLVLLASAGLFLRSLRNAFSIDIGMKPDNILLMAFDPKLHGYSRTKTQQFLISLRERVSALPGVRSVSFVDSLPLSIGGTGYNFKAVGEDTGTDQEVGADVYGVGSGFFETMGIPLLRGREFNRQSDDEHVAIVNETMARHLFGSGNPVGREIAADKTRRTVIGIARNAGTAPICLLRQPPKKSSASMGFRSP